MITKEEYNQKKDQLVQKLSIANQGGSIALQKNSSNLFRLRQQAKNTTRIDARGFNNVISIDKKNLIAEVEGMTIYEDLVKETLKHGLMPTVVPELKTITVGGAAAGIGIEATSFKYGLVHETITELEILLSSREVVICTPDNDYSDLFFGFPNSYGTLGYALRVRIKLIPVKKYVKVEHWLYEDAETYFADLKKFSSEQKYDFVDGVIFSAKKMYINLAVFTDEAPFTSDYTYLKIYYRSIKERKVDYLATVDYIWRWDTDWFWCSKNLGMEYWPFRLLLGRKRLGSKFYNSLRRFSAKSKILQSLAKLNKNQEAVIQDVEIPIDNCRQFLNFFQKNIGIKPVWVCPVRASDSSARFSLYPMTADTWYVNFGFWDYVPSTKISGFYNRLVEEKVRELNGKKSLYSDSYYSPAVFWQLYNKPVYNKLKNKYDSKGLLLNLYDKCVKRR